MLKPLVTWIHDEASHGQVVAKRPPGADSPLAGDGKTGRRDLGGMLGGGEATGHGLTG